ncbi:MULTISPECIES: MGMT family protein [Helicobacter]|uniref:MGMT family protein n=1 Tax=Helicobacter TaxID=209 RepID=UPI00263258CF|nr:MGMT family protein [Helicobacter sp. UBA3407]
MFALQRKKFDLPLSPYGTEFQKSVWEELCEIPYGEVQTYGAIAQKSTLLELDGTTLSQQRND